jgi:hypothetical protein
MKHYSGQFVTNHHEYYIPDDEILLPKRQLYDSSIYIRGALVNLNQL